MMQRTPIRNEWLGEKTFIIGGGPSVNECDISLLQGKGRVIVTNNAYKIAPWADWLVFSDCIWYEWHKDALRSVKMPIITGGYFTNPYDVAPEILHWKTKNYSGTIKSENGGSLSGKNAGHMALSLADFLGSSKIILIGFDMNTSKDGSTQWHNEHKRPTNTSMYDKEFIPEFNVIAGELKDKGVSVFNINKNSALKCFDYISYKDSLDI